VPALEKPWGLTGEIIVAISNSLFAYSTLIGWNYYGEKAIEYLLGSRCIRIYRVFFIAAVDVGAMRPGICLEYFRPDGLAQPDRPVVAIESG
jgi:Na+/alanine symporter